MANESLKWWFYIPIFIRLSHLCKELIMKYIEKWSVNESLLQSYRQIFINTQSIMLATGAVILGKSDVLMWVLVTMGLVTIWYIWFPVVRARHLIVDYYKYLSMNNGHSSDVIKKCSEHDYVNIKKKRVALNKELGITGNFRLTRLKIDIVLPVLYSIVWIVLMMVQMKVFS